MLLSVDNFPKIGKCVTSSFKDKKVTYSGHYLNYE